MFAKIYNKSNYDNTINGCKIVSKCDETILFPFCTDVIYLNEINKIGIEFNWDNRIRIVGVLTTEINSFNKMMDTLVLIAKRFEYQRLFFFDSLSEEVLKMFLMYGFKETQVLDDSYNHYLDMDLLPPKK